MNPSPWALFAWWWSAAAIGLFVAQLASRPADRSRRLRLAVWLHLNAVMVGAIVAAMYADSRLLVGCLVVVFIATLSRLDHAEKEYRGKSDRTNKPG